ncbi:Spy/CpxP family protein refolding chaperone [Thermodesulfovibrio sp. TK110]
MKKLLSIMVMALVVAVFAGVSFAQKGMGPQYPIGVDPAKAQQYCKEVQPLYQKDLQLRGELLTLWAQPNPDWNAIKQKEQERANLKVEMHKKAYEMGLPYAPGGKRGLKIRRICGW